MELKDVQEFLAQDLPEVKEYLQGLKTPTLEGVQQFVSTNDDAKKWFDSEKDRHFDKGLNTWMEKTFPTKLEEEIKKRFPDETAEQKENRELKQRIEALEMKEKMALVKDTALKVANEKNIPLSIVDMVLDQDETKTLESLTKFEEAMKEYVQKEVEERLKDGDYTPPAGNGNNNNLNGLSPTQLISRGFTHTK